MSSRIFDLAVRCPLLVTLDADHGSNLDVKTDWLIGITGSTIAKIAPWGEGQWQARKTIEAPNRLVMPGLINGHTHLAMTLMRGLADDQPIQDWLNRRILPIERQLVDEEYVETGVELAALESIRCGVTTVCDMYYYSKTGAEVLDRAGLRGIVSESLMDSPTPGNPDPQSPHFEKLISDLCERLQGHSRITPAVSAHAPYSCSDATLIRVREIAKKHDIRFLSHMSEGRDEVPHSVRQYGKGPLRRYFDLGLLGPKSALAHCVHVDDADLKLLASTQTAVIYNPESNMKLGSGVAPISRMLQMGIRVGLGTDGSASNNDINLFREMDSAVKLQKLVSPENDSMKAQDAVNLATRFGAQALGLESQIGSLEVGKKADLISIDLNHPNLHPIHSLSSLLVYAASGMEVDTVICDGKILMEGTQFKTLDSRAIYAKAQRLRDQMDRLI